MVSLEWRGILISTTKDFGNARSIVSTKSRTRTGSSPKPTKNFKSTKLRQIHWSMINKSSSMRTCSRKKLRRKQSQTPLRNQNQQKRSRWRILRNSNKRHKRKANPTWSLNVWGGRNKSKKMTRQNRRGSSRKSSSRRHGTHINYKGRMQEDSPSWVDFWSTTLTRSQSEPAQSSLPG
mgnify:CR=1 FL=1